MAAYVTDRLQEHEKRASDKAVIAQLRIDEAQQKGQIASDASKSGGPRKECIVFISVPVKETKMMERDARGSSDILTVQNRVRLPVCAAEVELQRQVDEREADAAAELFQEEKTRAEVSAQIMLT